MTMDCIAIRSLGLHFEDVSSSLALTLRPVTLGSGFLISEVRRLESWPLLSRYVWDSHLWDFTGSLCILTYIQRM